MCVQVGGFEAYLLADDDKQGDAAAEEVYRVGADGEESGVLNVSAAPNTLNLVLRDEGLMKFVKVRPGPLLAARRGHAYRRCTSITQRARRAPRSS